MCVLTQLEAVHLSTDRTCQSQRIFGGPGHSVVISSPFDFNMTVTSEENAATLPQDAAVDATTVTAPNPSSFTIRPNFKQKYWMLLQLI